MIKIKYLTIFAFVLCLLMFLVSGCYTFPAPAQDPFSNNSLITKSDNNIVEQLYLHDPMATSNSLVIDAFKLVGIQAKGNQQQQSSGSYFLVLGSYSSGTVSQEYYMTYLKDTSQAIRMYRIILTNDDSTDPSDNQNYYNNVRIIEDSTSSNSYIVIGKTCQTTYYVIHVPPGSINQSINMNL